MTSRAEVVAEARSWIGTPCHHHAGLKGIGADCGGMVRGVGAALGLEPPDWEQNSRAFHGYPQRGAGAMVKAALDLYADPIPLAALQPGDIILLRFPPNPEPAHCAICTEFRGAPGMIHVYAKARRVAEHNIDTLWRGRMIAAYAFRGIA
jgi:NlpC/P60 family putative phage cell wall peptidase